MMLVPYDVDPRRQLEDFVQHGILSEFPDAPSPPAEIVYEDMPTMDEVDEAAGPCPGGLEDECVLISFRPHIVASI